MTALGFCSWTPALNGYLGVDFRSAEPRKVGSDISIYLSRLSRALLKPQQRLKIVRCFLLPRHLLVWGLATFGKLRVLDIKIRVAVRRWPNRVPNDVPTAFFHSPVASGGLGIPVLATTVSGLVFQRLRSLETSTVLQAIACHHTWATRRREWARHALTHDGVCLATKHLRDEWWSCRLHQSVDGFELRECRDSNLFSWWVDRGSHAFPSRDYVQYVHVLVNTFPIRIQISRGMWRELRHQMPCRLQFIRVGRAHHS